jgi:Family of unknown function (DUF6502)
MQETVRSRTLAACHSFLVSVARFLLQSGISFREFDEVARAAFVQAATEDYGIRGRLTNTSRVSAMTGISRKQVRLIRETSSKFGLDPRADLSPLGDLLHRWYTDDDYRDASGVPRPLPFSGAETSFESLVRRYLGDLPANAIRVELVRYGAVIERSDGLLHAVRREIVPDSFDEKLISSIAFNLSGLASTIAFNSNPTRESAGRIERFVQSEILSQSEQAKMRAELRERIKAFTEQLDDLFSVGARTGIDPTGRVGVGVYYCEAPETASNTDARRNLE